METRMTLAVSTISALAVIPFAAIAQADSFEAYQFQSPSGNISCAMTMIADNASASCAIVDHTWVAPPRPARCERAWGDRIEMDQGSAPALVCSSDVLRGGETLNYGDAQSVGPITCTSELAGMTCTDARTGHFFRIARE